MLKKIVADFLPFAFRECKRWTDRGVMHAQWIVLPGDENTPRTVAYRNHFVLEKAETFRLGVCADAVYRLYLDGEFVAAGPEQGDLKHTFLDLFECTLKSGEHSLVAMVSSFAQLGPYSRMEFRHGFFFTAKGEPGSKLDSGSANWQAYPISGHQWQPTWGCARAVGQELLFDASGYPAGIESGAGDNWVPVTELYPGRDARLANEYKPQPLFYPATLPAMLNTSVDSYTVRYWGPHNGRYYAVADNRNCELAEVEHALRQGTLRILANTKIKLLLELDNYYCALPLLIVSGGRGAKISLGWTEALSLDEEKNELKGIRDEWENRYFFGTYDYFIPDGREKMCFYMVHYRAGRFISLEIETAEEELRLENFSLKESRYPLTFEGSFESSCNDLNELAKISQRTLEMCSHDTFMDCPFYEQLMYLGDTRIQALLTLTVSRDSRLVEKALLMFAASQMEDGFLQSRYPSQTIQVIPTFSP